MTSKLNTNKVNNISYSLVSIITVVFNGEKYLEETILSVINQSYGNIEYIIVDGGSTDGTLNFIKKYEDKIDYWISEPDNGIYDAMNKAISIANGEYINFMNAGDSFVDLTTLEKVVPFLKEDFVYGNHKVFLNNVDDGVSVNVESYSGKRNIPFCHQSLFARSSCLLRYPFDLNYKIAADYKQYLDCFHSGASMKHIPIEIANFLDGGLSMSSRKALIKEYYTITKKYDFFSATMVYIIRLIKFKLLGK